VCRPLCNRAEAKLLGGPFLRDFRISMNPPVYILGDGPCARALAAIMRAPRIGRRGGDGGWEWPKAAKRQEKPPEAVRLLLAADPSLGVSQWIRRHADARDCPFVLARRTGVLLYGMNLEIAEELRRRDVFARMVALPDTNQTFGTWGPDLMVLDDQARLGDLLAGLATLETLLQTAWDSLRRRANCLPALLSALEGRDAGALSAMLGELNQIDWDARCFPRPDFGDHHAWANRIHTWLNTVTVGVPPEWDEGLSLFLPFERKSD